MMHRRAATLADLEVITALEAALFTTDAWSRELIAAEIEAPWTNYRVALDASGDVIGYAGASIPSPGAPADIQTIAVDPAHRRHGLGRALLRELLDWAIARGATESLLEVRADNPGAQALYVELGYQPIAIRPRYYQPGNVDAVVMRATLDSTTARPPSRPKENA